MRSPKVLPSRNYNAVSLARFPGTGDGPEPLAAVGEQVESGMSLRVDVRSKGPEAYHDLSGRRMAPPRAGYVLAVSGALAAVTFTLVYLTTLSYATSF